MAHRRIVPDASVMLPAFFPEVLELGEGTFDLTKRALPVVHQIRPASVRAFAPEHLRHEFIHNAREKASPRTGVGQIDVDDAFRRIEEMLALPIVYVAGREIANIAMDLIRQSPISTADAWYLACAIHADAELWLSLSHEHADGIVQLARRVHPHVYVLTSSTF